MSGAAAAQTVTRSMRPIRRSGLAGRGICGKSFTVVVYRLSAPNPDITGVMHNVRALSAIETINIADYTRAAQKRVQRRLLAAAIDAAGTSGPWQVALRQHHAWARGGSDPLGLDVMLQRRSSLATLVNRLAAARNAAWAKRIKAQLANGQVAFVAVERPISTAPRRYSVSYPRRDYASGWLRRR